MPPADEFPPGIDSRIEALRQAALRFGGEMNMLERATCDHDGCTLPACPDAAMETVTLRRVLEVLADEWDPDDLPEDPGIGPMELRRIQRFRQALLEFGAALGLFACDCGEEVCPKRNPHALTTLDLLAVVRGEWHARAGCLFRCQHSVAAERVARVQAVLERNRARLPALRDQIASASAADWDAAARATAAAGTPLYREARAAAAHALEVWVRQRDAALDHAQHALRQAPAARGWDAAAAAAFVRASAAALDALLVRDVVAPEMFAALYAPLEPLAPFADLDAAPAAAGPSRWTGLN